MTVPDTPEVCAWCDWRGPRAETRGTETGETLCALCWDEHEHEFDDSGGRECSVCGRSRAEMQADDYYEPDR